MRRPPPRLNIAPDERCFFAAQTALEAGHAGRIDIDATQIKPRCTCCLEALDGFPEQDMGGACVTSGFAGPADQISGRCAMPGKKQTGDRFTALLGGQQMESGCLIAVRVKGFEQFA